jgi:hypothetical protein
MVVYLIFMLNDANGADSIICKCLLKYMSPLWSTVVVAIYKITATARPFSVALNAMFFFSIPYDV